MSRLSRIRQEDIDCPHTVPGNWRQKAVNEPMDIQWISSRVQYCAPIYPHQNHTHNCTCTWSIPYTRKQACLRNVWSPWEFSDRTRGYFWLALCSQFDNTCNIQLYTCWVLSPVWRPIDASTGIPSPTGRGDGRVWPNNDWHSRKTDRDQRGTFKGSVNQWIFPHCPLDVAFSCGAKRNLVFRRRPGSVNQK